jgi:hypothetical protein
VLRTIGSLASHRIGPGRQEQLSGALVEKKGSTDVADNEADAVEALTQGQLRAGACTHRTDLGPRASQKVLTLQGAMPKESSFKQTLCTEMPGRSLHAYLPCGAATAKRWNSFSSTSPARGLRAYFSFMLNSALCASAG